MGNGHPIAGLVAKTELVQAFQQESSYFNTFGGNPVSCAVGMAVLEVLEEEKLLENAAQTGQYLRQGIQALMDDFEVVGDVRGNGLFVALELVQDRETKEAATDAANTVVNNLKQNGVLLSRAGRYRNVLKIRPPLIFAQEHADLLVSELQNALKQV